MRSSLAVCAALALFTALPVLAQSDVRTPGAPWLSNIELPRATAMGGAHSAVVTGNDALFSNPAGLAQGRKYHLEVDGLLDARFPATSFTASITDSSTGPMATGLFWQRWGSGKEQGRASGWLAGLGYSYQAGSLLFGGVTKYLRFNTPLMDDAPDGTVHQFMQDFGLLARRGTFSWALVMQNISTTPHPLFPLTGTAGVAWGADASSHFAFDYKVDLHDVDHVKHKIAAGYEMLVDAFALRAGGTYDASNSIWWFSVGLGLLTEKGGAQIVYRRRLSGEFDQFFQAGLTLYLE
jgi:hypothetical protein